MLFNDGQKERFDLVIGADGLRSNVRSLAFDGNRLKSYGWNILGMWTHPNKDHLEGYYVLSGANESMVSFPYHDKHLVGFMFKANESDWPKPPQDAEDMLRHFPILKEDIRYMISAMEGNFSKIFCDKLQYVDMREWSIGRVVLIGDARHGMSPLTGMGTSLALEDGYVLADELNKNQDAESAIQNFTKRRNVRLQSMKIFKKLTESTGFLNSGLEEKICDIGIRLMPNALPKYLFKKIFETKI